MNQGIHESYHSFQDSPRARCMSVIISHFAGGEIWREGDERRRRGRSGNGKNARGGVSAALSSNCQSPFHGIKPSNIVLQAPDVNCVSQRISTITEKIKVCNNSTRLCKMHQHPLLFRSLNLCPVSLLNAGISALAVPRPTDDKFSTVP